MIPPRVWRVPRLAPVGGAWAGVVAHTQRVGQMHAASGAASSARCARERRSMHGSAEAAVCGVGGCRSARCMSAMRAGGRRAAGRGRLVGAGGAAGAGQRGPGAAAG